MGYSIIIAALSLLALIAPGAGDVRPGLYYFFDGSENRTAEPSESWFSSTASMDALSLVAVGALCYGLVMVLKSTACRHSHLSV
mmetsp:Transcript_73165/g.136743  ORF Transcript_73165/g.136743 Transcript_73165/m.136743 type:complete len:84 (-) Transcript_73165:60-311(-)